MATFKDNLKENPKIAEKLNVKNIARKDMDTEKANAARRMENIYRFCVWLLITLGVCIIFTTFFYSMIHVSGRNNAYTMSGKIVENRAKVKFFDNEEDSLIAIEAFRLEENEQNSNRSIRLNNLYDKIEKHLNGCKEDSCQIACANVADIFAVLHDVIVNSLCSSIHVLLLENPNIPSGVLKNYWLPANISFNEVIINFGKNTVIKSDAFNSPLFQDTQVLTLNNKFITKIENDSLMGFQRLKYLTIKTPIKDFQFCTLQPVEKTLLSLNLNGHLKLNGRTNIFENIFLNNLTFLDLSHNIFNGSLGKMLFESTPNLKHLIIIQSHIQHIEEDAFESLADKLLFVNLSKNRLTTLAVRVFEPILVRKHKAVIDLVGNDWICDCLLQEFANIYHIYSLQFMPVLYCKGPHHLYGTPLDEVDFDLENCLPLVTTEQGITEDIKSTTLKGEQNYSKEISTVENQEVYTSFPAYTTQSPLNLKMRCFDNDQTAMPLQSNVLKRQVRSSDDKSLYMEFPPPDYEFDLEINEENNSVIVTVYNPPETFLVIWFSEEKELSVATYDDIDLDYECKYNVQPQLIVGPLQANTTYTFCVLSSLQNDISPFNCLPLYVPANRNQNLWISEDKKHLTIGMLCLMFLFSTIAGAGISYVGLKTYPDLLEGSKNGLFVKNNDQTYVTTISEIEYQKQSSLKNPKACAKLHSIKKLPLPETPYCISVQDLGRTASVKSSSTCFEDALNGFNFVADGYETPRICSDENTVEQKKVENIYCTTPRSPPPLPKRNSNTSNCSTVVLNRLSKNSDVL